tara:strand:- start:761 stop:961 length:201 start_codon:yes stop_codon:yes gene_type:complete
MSYNPNNPSNWSWSKAFAEMDKTVHEAEMTQQIINHLHNYDGGEKEFKQLDKENQEEMYNILNQIL